MEIKQVEGIKLNFILATARTGSTLLSSMLNAHPNVISTIEEPFAFNLFPKYKRAKKWTTKTIQEFCYDFYLFSEGKLGIQFGTKKELETLLETHKPNLNAEVAIKLAYLCFFPNKEKKEITAIVDKQLKFHSHLEKVARFYPTSKFIILYRDPRDTVLLTQKVLKIEGKDHTNIYEIAHSWNYVYGRLSDLKTGIGTDRFLEMKYEDLVLNPEAELKKVCSFLNISYNPAMLQYDEQIKKEMIENENRLGEDTKNLISLLHGGLSQKVHTEKINIWKQELKPAEVNLVWSVCGKLAKKIGYAKGAGFVKQGSGFKYTFTFLSILLKRIYIDLYYALPFFIKRFIKKIKYGKRFKSDGYTSKDYYKRSYHSN
ncbi:MAG TPA: sulfotransferase [Bacteroidia bacterium]|jgi:hypothetical protein|nr:sulfotransferase [Bacteroidia bacterium]